MHTTLKQSEDRCGTIDQLSRIASLLRGSMIAGGREKVGPYLSLSNCSRKFLIVQTRPPRGATMHICRSISPTKNSRPLAARWRFRKASGHGDIDVGPVTAGACPALEGEVVHPS
jgi:hypothetical protein